MNEDEKRLRRLTPREINAIIDVITGIICIDLITGGHLRRLGAAYMAWAARTWEGHHVDPLSPSEKSALQEEARRITQEAGYDLT